MAQEIFRLALGKAIFLPYGNAVRYVLKEGHFKRWLDDAVFVKGQKVAIDFCIPRLLERNVLLIFSEKGVIRRAF